MKRFQTVVGIDPSGKRLAVAAIRGGFGRPVLCAPLLVADLRSEREQQLLSEAEGVLSDFVARTGLVGSAARLCIPADHVYTARVSFPRLREKDQLQALELELERLFPFPPSRLRFGWRRLAAAEDGKNVTLVVTAVPSDYLEPWENAVSRAGLRLTGAIPVGWALSSALSIADRGRGETLEPTAILRDAGENVECSVLLAGVPVFSASRPCAVESMPAEALSLLAEGLVDLPFPGEETSVSLISPSGWFGGEERAGWEESTVRDAGDFPPFPYIPTAGQGASGEYIPVRRIAGAVGAAAGGRAVDLVERRSEGAGYRLARLSGWVIALAAIVLAHAWPATLYWKTKAELSRLDAEITALRPVVTDVEKKRGDMAATEAKISLLREAAEGRWESFLILKELTDRLPEGTWLTGLRVEDRKVEIDGLSPSANEIFPLLTRDGRFQAVAFSSPITRQADNLERFRIRAEFVPARPSGTEESG